MLIDISVYLNEERYVVFFLSLHYEVSRPCKVSDTPGFQRINLSYFMGCSKVSLWNIQSKEFCLT